LVAATGWLGYTAFVSAFPEPISSWQMSRIEAAGSDDVMLGPCLEFCSENGDAACVSQCHRRQMGYVLGKAGIELEGDPKLLPSQFRHQQLEQVNRVVATLDGAEAITCDALSRKIDQVPRWSPRLETAFESVYVEEFG